MMCSGADDITEEVSHWQRFHGAPQPEPEAMAVTIFLTLFLESIIQHLPVVSDEVDEATHERMQQRAEQLRQKMTWLLQELEQRIEESGGFAWKDLLFAALQHWQFWILAGVLVQVLGIWWWVRKSSHVREGSDEEESSSSSTELQENEEEDEDANDVGKFLVEHIQWPAQNLAEECTMAWVLVCNFCCIFRKIIANTLLPMPHQPIKVGSAFEGWSPLEKDIIYRVFVPLLPPPWHCFKTEPCIARETPARNFQVRVDLECGCITSYLQSKGLCFLHHFRELRKNHVPNILDTLCTNFYLDVNKTAQWFHLLVTSAWKFFPLSSRCCLTMLPSSRSCKFCITGDSKSITIEMMFGVQQHSSDIFVSNESPEGIFMRNTIWSESYAVAEAKFFRELGSQAPHGSFHLECLRVCARILVGTGFSTYVLKTVVMHLLTTIPLKDWRERDFLLRLRDIMQYLRVCLEEKRLYHFFFGNKKVPKGLDLPLDLQEAEAVNLFYYLVGNPDAHAKALREFMQLRYWLTRLLSSDTCNRPSLLPGQ